MGRTGRLGGLAVVVFGLVLTARVAQADYVVSIQDAGGASGMTAALGDSVRLVVDLTSNVADTHDSFATDVVFSVGGLVYDAYDLASPEYLTGDPATDYSDPAGGVLGPGGFLLEAVTASGGTTFGEGALATFDLSIPMSFPLGGGVKTDVAISASPQFFANGFTSIPATAGPSFVLNVVPEPAMLALVGLGGLAALRRRRRTA